MSVFLFLILLNFFCLMQNFLNFFLFLRARLVIFSLCLLELRFFSFLAHPIWIWSDNLTFCCCEWGIRFVDCFCFPRKIRQELFFRLKKANSLFWFLHHAWLYLIAFSTKHRKKDLLSSFAFAFCLTWGRFEEFSKWICHPEL